MGFNRRITSALFMGLIEELHPHFLWGLIEDLHPHFLWVLIVQESKHNRSHKLKLKLDCLKCDGLFEAHQAAQAVVAPGSNTANLQGKAVGFTVSVSSTEK